LQATTKCGTSRCRYRINKDSRIDSRDLGPTGPTVSPSVPDIGEVKAENSIKNTGESHRDSQLVTVSPDESKWRREGDSNPTKFH
jgi:hypothetical protein